MKKHYNPFKMWGSYVGIILFYIIEVLFLKMFSGLSNWDSYQGLSFMEIFPKTLGFVPGFPNGFSIGALIFTIVMIIIGFLIGYGIHALIRKFRR